jgi:hypothetical protein
MELRTVAKRKALYRRRQEPLLEAARTSDGYTQKVRQTLARPGEARVRRSLEK